MRKKKKTNIFVALETPQVMAIYVIFIFDIELLI